MILLKRITLYTVFNTILTFEKSSKINIQTHLNLYTSLYNNTYIEITTHIINNSFSLFFIFLIAC